MNLGSLLASIEFALYFDPEDTKFELSDSGVRVMTKKPPGGGFLFSSVIGVVRSNYFIHNLSQKVFNESGDFFDTRIIDNLEADGWANS